MTRLRVRNRTFMEWAAAAALFYGNDSKIYFAHKKLRKYLRISKKSSTFAAVLIEGLSREKWRHSRKVCKGALKHV